MARDGFGGPKLPKVLLDKVQDGSVNKRKRDLSRKDRRKAERQQKKGNRSRPASAPPRRAAKQEKWEDDDDDDFDDEDEDDAADLAPPPKKASKSVEPAKPVKSILKKPPPQPESDSEDESEDEENELEDRVSSRTHKARLADDDDEIAVLEKKLGRKAGQKSKAADEDDLDWLLGDGEGEEEEENGRSAKRKRPEDDKWLEDKRRKANGKEVVAGSESGDSDEDMDGLSDIEDEDEEESDDGELQNPFSEDEGDSDDFDGFEEEGEKPVPMPKKERENPYVPPVSKDAAPVEKYVPPSLRKPSSSDDELLKQLRRQAQGQLNRVSEDNMLSIVQAIEQLYAKNARGHVTSTMVDLLIGLIADRTALNENFLLLHAGFATALYKVTGIDFGAQLVERIVQTFDQYRGQAEVENKQTLNLIAFASYLYTFGLVGPVLIFDFIRLLLDEVTETNTELLLRVVRTCGPQLRQDDPSSLKDVVLSLQRSVAKIGEDKLSVRTKFMMETINNLKNNRMKTGLAASAIASEHTIRMKKTLGALSARTNKATEPLRISLADIRDSDTKGKWWLVGASYKDPAKMAANGSSSTKATSLSASADPDAGYESETPGSVNLQKLARAQGMNTDVRRAVFVSLLSASDYKDGHMRLLKLHLKSKQEFEIPRVLLQCAGAESSYNQYYTLVAKKLCAERRFSKAFQFSLLGLFNQMGEKEDADADDEDEGRDMSVRKVVNLAKMYGHLIADGGMSLTALKTLQFGFLKEKTSMFVEVLVTTVLLQLRKKAGEEGFEVAVKDVFDRAHEVPEMVMGLKYFVEAVVDKADVAGGKGEKRTVKSGCVAALEALQETAGRVAAVNDDESD